MQANAARVLSWIGLSEGGYVNNPKDPGGATDRGITQRTFDAWNRKHGLPLRPVKGISKATAEAILADQYLRPVRFADLPSGLDYAVADYAVNSGPSRAAKDLQRALGRGLSADGIIGAQTLAAVKDVEQDGKLFDLIENYVERRHQFMRVAKHPKTGALLWPTFGKGWKTRLFGTTAGAQTTDVGVLDRALLMVREGASPVVAPPPTIPGPGKSPEAEAPTPRLPLGADNAVPWPLVAVIATLAALAGAMIF